MQYMSEFPIHSIDSSPVDARELLERVQQKYGFVPNFLGELAAAPAALKTYLALGDLLGETGLTPIEQQLVLGTVSVANGCHYCVAAHSAGLKRAGLPPDQIEAVREDRSLASPKLEALRTLTMAIVRQRGWISQPDLQQFMDAGYRREQVFDVLVGVAMKTLSNYANHIAATPLDEKFERFAWTAAAK